MNQNYNPNNTIFNGAQPNTVKPNLNIILYVLMALTIVGCFLPYLNVSVYGFNESTNYVIYDGNVKDGVYVIALIIAAFFACQKKSYKSAIICIAIAVGIFAFDFIDSQNRMDELTYGGLVDTSWGIGFYIVGVSLIASLVCAIIINKNAPLVQPVPVNNTIVNAAPMYNQTQVLSQQANIVPNQATSTCQYCGNPRNEGLFCKSCGGRY